MARTWIFWLSVAVMSSTGAESLAEEQRPPNILLLIADDQGWRDIGYHDSDIKTPVLDKLAAGGVRLERHYVCPTCSPTRAGLLTGRRQRLTHAEARPAEMTPEPPESLARLLMWELANEREDCCA